MATKKGSSKTGSSKKSAKKSSKKSSKKTTKAAAIPPPNLRCILACADRYARCLQKGVPQATCQKRLQRCIMNCIATGVPIFEE